jgi:hypothetical protein
MSRGSKSRSSPKVLLEYENLGVPPAYVEGAQGMRTPLGALQVSFYSEYIKPRETLELDVESQVSLDNDTVSLKVLQQDPFMSDPQHIRMARRIEANLIFTLPALQALIPWLQQKLDEMEKHDSSNALVSTPQSSN